MIENNLLHKSGAKSTLRNVSIKVFLFLSHIFIHTCPSFAVTSCPSATSKWLSVSSNEPGIKSEISGVMYHVAPESKIQLRNCELSPTFPLGHESLPDIRAIDAYIFWSLFFCCCCVHNFLFHLKSNFFHYFSFSFGCVDFINACLE